MGIKVIFKQLRASSSKERSSESTLQEMEKRKDDGVTKSLWRNTDFWNLCRCWDTIVITKMRSIADSSQRGIYVEQLWKIVLLVLNSLLQVMWHRLNQLMNGTPSPPAPGNSTISQMNITFVEKSWHGRKPLFKFENSQFLEAEAIFEILVSTWSSRMTSPANPALAACKAFLANLKLFELISFFQHLEQREDVVHITKISMIV